MQIIIDSVSPYYSSQASVLCPTTNKIIVISVSYFKKV